VRRTQRAIKHVLTERYYTWQDAKVVAETDPEMDMNAADGKIYTPSDDWYENDEVREDEIFEDQEIMASSSVETTPEVKILPETVSESTPQARTNM
jgi:large subunit ribosomal protein L47